MKLVGIKSDTVTSAHGVTIQTDTTLDKVTDLADAIVLPGGMPGAENLANSSKLKDMIVRMNEEGKIVAAICASPALVLTPTGILKGRTATCYPGLDANFTPDIKKSKDRVVQDGNIITSQGPATAFVFGLKIAENLVGSQKADMIASQMLYQS